MAGALPPVELPYHLMSVSYKIILCYRFKRWLINVDQFYEFVRDVKRALPTINSHKSSSVKSVIIVNLRKK